MARALDNVNVFETRTRRRVGGLGCSRVRRSGLAMGIGLGREVCKMARDSVGFVREVVAGFTRVALKLGGEYDWLWWQVNACAGQNSDKPNKRARRDETSPCAPATTTSRTDIHTQGQLHQFPYSPLCTQLEHALHRLPSPSSLLAATAAAFVAPLVCGSSQSSSDLTTTPLPPPHHRRHLQTTILSTTYHAHCGILRNLLFLLFFCAPTPLLQGKRWTRQPRGYQLSQSHQLAVTVISILRLTPLPILA
jgi:hypothetical protein